MQTQQSQNIPADDAQCPSPSPSLRTAAALATIPTPPPTPNTHEASVAEKKRHQRGSSFKTVEDEYIVNSWIRVSEDSVVGAEQKGETFYREITEYYNSIRPSYRPQRSTESIKKRVKKLLCDCQAFGGCVARVTRVRPSGASDEDVLHLATALFNKLNISSVQEECGPEFRHLSCWKILKDHPKFELILHPPTAKTSDEPTDTNTRDQGSDCEPELTGSRPTGRKRQKEMDQKGAMDIKKLKVAQATLEAQQERNILMKTHQEMLLFTTNPDSSDPMVMEYMSIMRARVLNRLRSENNNTSPQMTPSDNTNETTDL